MLGLAVFNMSFAERTVPYIHFFDKIQRVTVFFKKDNGTTTFFTDHQEFSLSK
jgi:hypothetical protein